MGKSFDKLLEIAQKIKNNELPESNTNTLVGGHLMDIIEKCSEAVDLINENKVETDGKIGQVEQVLTESNLISLKDYSDTDLTNG